MAIQRVRMGVVGVGGMGSNHCTCIDGLEETELTAVVDIDPERAREVGEKFEVPYFTRAEEMFQADLADAISIATPHYFHPPIAVAAFQAGYHVLSEKPIGVRVSRAQKMVEAARRAEKVFAVMFQRRTQPQVRRARQLVADGVIGEVQRTVLISPEFRSQAYYDSGGWRATWAGEGGGVMMNQAPHIMDLFTLLGGMPTRVRGQCSTRIHDIEVEDHAEATLEYENGATGYFCVSTCEPGPGQLLQIFGDRGKLTFQDGKLSVTTYKPSVSEFNASNTEQWGKPEAEELELELPECESGHREIVRNFARAILAGEPLLAPGREGLRSLELANAIMLSSAREEPVDLPIDPAAFDELLERLCETSAYEPGQAARTSRQSDPGLSS